MMVVVERMAMGKVAKNSPCIPAKKSTNGNVVNLVR